MTQAPPRLLEHLPLFPLPRVVLFPHTLLPLHIFEPRYRALVATATQEDLTFGIPTMHQGGPTSGALPAFHPVMGLAQVVRHQPLADGRSNIVVLGVGRARLVEELHDPSVPYRSARCERLDDIRTPPEVRDGVSQKIADLRLAALQVVHGRADVTEEVERLLDGKRHPTEVVDVLAHMCLRCPDERLAYLNLLDFPQRADHLLGVLTSILYAQRSPVGES